MLPTSQWATPSTWPREGKNSLRKAGYKSFQWHFLNLTCTCEHGDWLAEHQCPPHLWMHTPSSLPKVLTAQEMPEAGKKILSLFQLQELRC